MTDLITEARELCAIDIEKQPIHAEVIIEELCDALEKAEEQNKQLLHELCKLACESVEREKNLARLEAEVMAACNSVRWVPVAERYPMPADLNQQGWVLGLFANGDVDFCGGKEAQHIAALTHWMPLPAPPEEGAEK